jgi:predicted membrane metal-binding protein
MKIQIYILILFCIVIFLRSSHSLEIYRNNLQKDQVEIQMLWKEDSASCWQSQNGILIYIPSCEQYKPGSYLRVIGSLSDRSDSNKNQQKTMVARQISQIYMPRTSPKYWFLLWWGSMANLRRNLLELVRQVLGYSGGSLLFSLVLGGSKHLPEEVQAGVDNLGLIYIFSASGMHVGILLEMIDSRIKLFQAKHRLWLQVLALFIYGSISLWRPAIVRSIIMALYRLFARLIWHKSSSPLMGLVWAILFMLLINPLWILEVGFLMSVVATLAILVVSKMSRGQNKYLLWEMGETSHGDSSKILSLGYTWQQKLWQKIKTYTRETAVFSLTAQLALLPLVIRTFGSWSYLGIISSCLSLWALPYVFRLGIRIFILLFFLSLTEIVMPNFKQWLEVWLHLLQLLTLPARGWLHGLSQVLSATSKLTWTKIAISLSSITHIWMWYIGWCTAIYTWYQARKYYSYQPKKEI